MKYKALKGTKDVLPQERLSVASRGVHHPLSLLSVWSARCALL